MAAKRKKAKTKAYGGYMKFPLCGADTYDDFRRDCEFYGDFAIPQRRLRIFSKPRKYRMQIWWKIEGADAYDVTDVSLPDEAVDKLRLSEVLTAVAKREMKEITQQDDISFADSYIKVMI